MHQTPHRPNPLGHSPGHRPPQEHREQQRPGSLSQSDPEPESPRRSRTAVWLVVGFVVLVSALVVLHLTGVAGPGAH